MRRAMTGSIGGIALSVGLGAAMVPLRPHLNLATAALVLVVPVVAGVIIGGFTAGVASVAAGFFVYDFGFIPPYYRLTVGRPENWVTLAVYAVVMLLVARVVASLESARSEAQRRAAETDRLFELSDLLVQDRSVDDLLRTIVLAVRTAFDVPGVTLLVPDGGRLEIAASAGEELTREELRGLEPLSGMPVSLDTGPGAPRHIRTVALMASGGPVGLLAMRGVATSAADRDLLRTFANHAALALERAQLRDVAVRAELLEEVDRLRHALMGAVSHDLRSPLATMKVASSILNDPMISLSIPDMHELHGLLDVETDRLTRLVTNLLDMTRIDAGVLELRPEGVSLADLVAETVLSLQGALQDRPVDVATPDWLPRIEVDRVLIGQVLANLLDNANRHAPLGTVITVRGELGNERMVVSVTDQGPGVPGVEKDAVFDRFMRFDTGGRSGLGLSIAKTFVEAHGEHIWVEDVAGGGARFVFTLPLAATAANGVRQLE